MTYPDSDSGAGESSAVRPVGSPETGASERYRTPAARRGKPQPEDRRPDDRPATQAGSTPVARKDRGRQKMATMRMPLALYRACAERAQAEGMSVSRWMREVLAKEVGM